MRLVKSTPIHELLPNDSDLRLTVENLFGKTDGIHSRFNKADSRAEENGLRNALCLACNNIVRVAKNVRFNRVEQVHPRFASAFDIYKGAGIQAYRTAVLRQRALTKQNDPADVQARQQTISILEAYAQTLSQSQSSHETVLGLFPEEIWREYAAAFK
jgi:hypothetical protein